MDQLFLLAIKMHLREKRNLTLILIILFLVVFIFFLKKEVFAAFTCDCWCTDDRECLWCWKEFCDDGNCTINCYNQSLGLFCAGDPCGGCFTGETEVEVGSGEGEGGSETKEIKDLKPGEIVSSFDPETGEISEGTVSDVTKPTREGYYILETESGEKVKVTGEHPFLAIKAKNNQSPVTSHQSLSTKLKTILSHTLTYKLLTALQARF